jgi:hypothetical protein
MTTITQHHLNCSISIECQKLRDRLWVRRAIVSKLTEILDRLNVLFSGAIGLEIEQRVGISQTLRRTCEGIESLGIQESDFKRIIGGGGGIGRSGAELGVFNRKLQLGRVGRNQKLLGQVGQLFGGIREGGDAITDGGGTVSLPGIAGVLSIIDTKVTVGNATSEQSSTIEPI